MSPPFGGEARNTGHASSPFRRRVADQSTTTEPVARESKIRVTYVVPRLETGGAERQLITLVNRLDRSRFEPAIVCLQADVALLNDVASDVPTRSFRVGPLWPRRRMRRFTSALMLGFTVMLELTLRRPRVVHSYLPAAYVVASIAAWLLHIPAIVAGRRSLLGIQAYRHGLWRSLSALANRIIHLHVCNSEATRQMTLITEQVEMSATTVIHNGIDLPDLSTSPPSLPVGWVVGSGEPAAVSLANLIWYKGHRVLLEAMVQVVANRPTFRLVLIGEGPERARIEASIRELELSQNVVLAGSLARASRLLCHFRFSVLASLEESFPNAAMESMAAAVPVVATRVGGITELVRDGRDGLLVPPRDPAALAVAMLELLSRPELARQMGESARQRIGECFSVEKMVGATEELYVRLLGSGSAGAGSDRSMVRDGRL